MLLIYQTSGLDFNLAVSLRLLRGDAADDLFRALVLDFDRAHVFLGHLLTLLASRVPHRDCHFASALLLTDVAFLELRRGGDDVGQCLHSHVRVEVCAPVQVNLLDGLDGLALGELRQQLVRRLAAQVVAAQE